MPDASTGARSLRDAPAPGRPQADRPVERPSIAGAGLAELLGTFMLVFFGLATVLAVDGADRASQKLAIGLAFGLAILAAAYSLGHVSGAHLNPAVTIGLAASRRFPASAVVPYVLAQVAGGLLGALAVAAVFPSEPGIAATVTQPGPEGVGAALLVEALLGFVLMLVVKGTAVDDRAEGAAAGLAIGLVIVAGHLAFIPTSGASFNPARSIASAVVGGELGDLWVYLLAPTAGAVVAALLYETVLRRVRPPDVDDVAA